MSMRHSTFFLLNPNKKENSNLEIGYDISKIYLEKVHVFSFKYYVFSLQSEKIISFITGILILQISAVKTKSVF